MDHQSPVFANSFSMRGEGSYDNFPNFSPLPFEKQLFYAKHIGYVLALFVVRCCGEVGNKWEIHQVKNKKKRELWLKNQQLRKQQQKKLLQKK